VQGADHGPKGSDSIDPAACSPEIQRGRTIESNPIGYQRSGRSGPAPALKKADDLDHEIRYTINTLQSLHQRGQAWSDMCLTYRPNWIGERIQQRPHAASIPLQWLADSQSKRSLDLNHDSVKLMTMHSSKGLEFPFIGIGYLSGQQGNQTQDAKLLYVAMTRSTDKLLMTYHQDTAFTRRLDKLWVGVADEKWLQLGTMELTFIQHCYKARPLRFISTN
jgi:superfamily I DNA/RNA helicase